MNKRKTSIVFTGDIGFDRYMDKRWEDENLLSKDVLDFFHSADHVVANVEGALIDAVDDGSRGVFFHSMNPEATRVLKDMHADIWSIGNNHTMDAGKEGVISTRKIAAELGCRTIGGGLNDTEASEPVYLDEAGGIGMFCVSYMNECIPATATEPGIFRWDDLDYIKRRMIYLEPQRFAQATDEEWEAYFLSDEPEGYVEGAHMDFNIMLPFARTAEEGAWKQSKLEAVKQYLLAQL